jgi:predicted HicB family RNase H-like nuclease
MLHEESCLHISTLISILQAKLVRELEQADFVDRGGKMKTSEQYLKIVEWSEEDKCYVGTCPGLMLGGIHGADETKVYRELCQAVEEWIELYRKDGQPLPAATAGRNYSRKFVVRVGPELHKTLAVDAFRRGESLNAHCVQLLSESGASYGAN